MGSCSAFQPAHRGIAGAESGSGIGFSGSTPAPTSPYMLWLMLNTSMVLGPHVPMSVEGAQDWLYNRATGECKAVPSVPVAMLMREGGLRVHSSGKVHQVWTRAHVQQALDKLMASAPLLALVQAVGASSGTVWPESTRDLVVLCVAKARVSVGAADRASSADAGRQGALPASSLMLGTFPRPMSVRVAAPAQVPEAGFEALCLPNVDVFQCMAQAGVRSGSDVVNVGFLNTLSLDELRHFYTQLDRTLDLLSPRHSLAASFWAAYPSAPTYGLNAYGWAALSTVQANCCHWLRLMEDMMPSRHLRPCPRLHPCATLEDGEVEVEEGEVVE